jgi:hypothetical protein
MSEWVREADEQDERIFGMCRPECVVDVEVEKQLLM